MPKLINKMQTGFMKGRKISDNILKLFTIIQHCNKHQIEAVLLNVDSEKAFDTIGWPAIK